MLHVMIIKLKDLILYQLESICRIVFFQLGDILGDFWLVLRYRGPSRQGSFKIGSDVLIDLGDYGESKRWNVGTGRTKASRIHRILIPCYHSICPQPTRHFLPISPPSSPTT